MKIIAQVAGAVALLILAGCSSPKQVPYVVDAETIPAEILSELPASPDPILQTGDLLNIEVTSSDMISVAPFNKGMYVTPEGTVTRMQRTTTTSTNGTTELSTDYYLVDNNGDIVFPIIGKIHATGLTKSELAEKVADAIYPKFTRERPNVDVRLMNFRVVALGAVRSPGVIRSTSERMNFFEAIAMAGDLDIKGERETILLYRTNPDGTRELHRLNIHDKNFLLSPYYNLQQNDIIYVVPNKSMANGSWSLSPAVNTVITLVGGISSIVALILTIINL